MESIEGKIKREIEREAQEMSKIAHWNMYIRDRKPGKRPKYMASLKRKQCNAILRVRTRMLQVKANTKSKYKENIMCRFCHRTPETQIHILQLCTEIPKENQVEKYEEIFGDQDLQKLGRYADKIISIMELLEKHPKTVVKPRNRQ